MEKNLSFDQLPKAVSQLNEKLDNIERLLLQYSSSQLKDHFDQPLNVQETADLMDLTKTTIYSKVSKGELPYHKRGKHLYFLRSELLDYIKKCRVKTNAEIEAEAGNSLINKKGVSHGR